MKKGKLNYYLDTRVGCWQTEVIRKESNNRTHLVFLCKLRVIGPFQCCSGGVKISTWPGLSFISSLRFVNQITFKQRWLLLGLLRRHQVSPSFISILKFPLKSDFIMTIFVDVPEKEIVY